MSPRTACWIQMRPNRFQSSSAIMAAVSTSRMHSVTRGACARTGPVRRRLAPMQATFKITLKTPTGDKVIDCDDDEYILAAAEVSGDWDLMPGGAHECLQH